MPKVLWGRTEKVALTTDDFVEVRDALGGVLSMPPNAARTLHRELGKFLSLENDGKPLAQPTRGDFKNLLARVEVLEKGQASMDSGRTDD